MAGRRPAVFVAGFYYMWLFWCSRFLCYSFRWFVCCCCLADWCASSCWLPSSYVFFGASYLLCFGDEAGVFMRYVKMKK